MEMIRANWGKYIMWKMFKKTNIIRRNSAFFLEKKMLPFIWKRQAGTIAYLKSQGTTQRDQFSPSLLGPGTLTPAITLAVEFFTH